MATMTQARQQTAVAEGLALGCLAINHPEITSDKLTIEAAFGSAWSKWLARSVFPQVNRDNVLHILIASGRHPHLLAWNRTGPTFRAYVVHENWTLEELAHRLANEHGVTLAQWKLLANALVDEL